MFSVPFENNFSEKRPSCFDDMFSIGLCDFKATCFYDLGEVVLIHLFATKKKKVALVEE